MRPTSIKADKNRSVLEIVWDDGMQSAHAFYDLAAACRCATCNDARARAQAEGREHKPQSSALEAIEAVGSYGINIIWKSGCRHGIYTWEYLRALASGHKPSPDHHRAW